MYYLDTMKTDEVRLTDCCSEERKKAHRTETLPLEGTAAVKLLMI